METLSLHRQFADRDDETAADELFKKWCTNPWTFIQPAEHLPQVWKLIVKRPVSEPPIFDYEEFVERAIPSDIQLEKRFPGDPVKKTLHRDFVTERRLLEKYWQWCQNMMETDPGRATFHRGLFNEIVHDFSTVDKEFSDTMGTQPDTLGVWEYWNLDRNGDTNGMCKRMEEGHDIFDVGDIAIREYGNLAPSGYFRAIRRVRLMEWDMVMLDNPAGGTEKLQRMLRHNVDVFVGKEYPEAKETYKHLIPESWMPLITLSDWLEEQEDEEEMTTNYEAQVAFIRERYMHLSKAINQAGVLAAEVSKVLGTFPQEQPRTLSRALIFGMNSEQGWTTGHHAHLGLRLCSPFAPLSLTILRPVSENRDQ